MYMCSEYLSVCSFKTLHKKIMMIGIKNKTETVRVGMGQTSLVMVKIEDRERGHCPDDPSVKSVE